MRFQKTFHRKLRNLAERDRIVESRLSTLIKDSQRICAGGFFQTHWPSRRVAADIAITNQSVLNKSPFVVQLYKDWDKFESQIHREKLAVQIESTELLRRFLQSVWQQQQNDKKESKNFQSQTRRRKARRQRAKKNS